MVNQKASISAKRRWERERAMKTNNLTTQQQEDLAWVAKHKQNIQTRNSIIVDLIIIADIVLVAGWLNYQMLLQISAWLPQFFAELGLLLPLIYINTKVIIKIYDVKSGSDVFAALVAATAALVAATVALAFVAAVFAAFAAVAEAIILSDNDD